MRDQFYGGFMISWIEKEPDFRTMPLVSGFRRLSLTTTVGLIFAPSGVQVVWTRGVKDKIYNHLAEQMVEMGGLLIGNVYASEDKQRLIVFVEDSMAALAFSGTRVSLSMNSDVWSSASRSAEGRGYIVGWYHSHPDLGAFFSSTDRDTQRAFFPSNHSLGLVVDPVRIEERWFSGMDSKEVDSSTVFLGSIAEAMPQQ
jgi:proteasome lid subunit RPN8/RPN11